MSTRPEPFETVILAVTATPIDLAANATISPAAPSNLGDFALSAYQFDQREIFIQCIAGACSWRETAAAPAADAKGHRLSVGDGVIVTVRRGRPFWVWSTTGGELAVSAASGAPVRETGTDEFQPPGSG